MKKALFLLVLVGLVLRPGGVAEAVILNGGFETGDLINWATSIPTGGSAQAVTSHTSDTSDLLIPTVYNPIEGNYFALLKADGPGSDTTLSQTFSISSGLRIEGWAAFDAWDYLPFDDNADVLILDALGTTVIANPWHSDVSTVGDYGDGPWTYWNWTAPTSGNYILQFRVTNSLDSDMDSYALFDAAGVIPEPATMLLFGSGLLGLIGLGKARKKKRN